jgi:dihydrofolate reductase
MELLQLRENKIFETLDRLKELNFVVIGGYAVNAYTLPRFSVDCDLVVKNNAVLKKIEKLLFKTGYSKINLVKEDFTYYGDFVRYEYEIEKYFKVSYESYNTTRAD